MFFTDTSHIRIMVEKSGLWKGYTAHNFIISEGGTQWVCDGNEADVKAQHTFSPVDDLDEGNGLTTLRDVLQCIIEKNLRNNKHCKSLKSCIDEPYDNIGRWRLWLYDVIDWNSSTR